MVETDHSQSKIHLCCSEPVDHPVQMSSHCVYAVLHTSTLVYDKYYVNSTTAFDIHNVLSYLLEGFDEGKIGFAVYLELIANGAVCH